MGDQTTKDNKAIVTKFENYFYGEHEDNHHEPDALHREVQGGGGSERTEARRVADGGEAYDPRKDLKTAAEGLAELKKLDGKTDAESIRTASGIADQVDMAFQRLVPHLTAKDGEQLSKEFGNAFQFDNIQKEREDINKQLGLPPGTKLEGDQLKNAILNAPNAAVRNLLTQAETLNEMEQVTVNKTADAMNGRDLSYKVGLSYAHFLEQYRPNGISADYTNPQNVFSSLDVLYQVNAARAAEFQAAGGDKAMRTASDTAANNANQVIPAEKNPLPLLGQAVQLDSQGNTAEAIAAAKKAVELAKQIDPKECQAKMAELQKQIGAAAGDQAKQQELQQQYKAWESLSHAGGLGNTILGSMLLQKQQPPDFEGARKALLAASADPEGANMMLDGRGKPMFTSLMMISMTKGDQSMVDKIQGVSNTMQQAQQKAAEADKEKDDGNKKKLLDEATALGEKALQESSILTKTFGGQNGKDLQKQIDELSKKPENERSENEKFTLAFLTQVKGLGDMQSQALMSVASWDMAKGDGHAAQKMLDQLNENDHPEFFAGKDDKFKAQFKEMKDAAASLAEDNDIDNKAWYNPMKYVDKAWKFCKDNAKWIAFGVACVAAVAVTCATAGAGAPVGLAILAGAGAGLVGGTVVGTGLELASGREKNVLDAAWKVAPYAASGGAVGAVGAYFFAPAAVAGMFGAEVGAGTGLGVASGFWGTMGGGAATGFAGGSLWNAGKVRDGLAVGKYDSAGEAFSDWATGTASWTINGALAAGPIKWGGSGLNSMRAAYAAGNLTKGAMVFDGLKLLGAGATAMSFPGTTDTLATFGNFELANATGHMPRWLGQSMGFSRQQVAEYNQMKASGVQPEAQVQQPQPQAQGDRVASPDGQQPPVEQPIEANPNYKPGQASYDDYLK